MKFSRIFGGLGLLALGAGFLFHDSQGKFNNGAFVLGLLVAVPVAIIVKMVAGRFL